ncbi:MAG TPA: SpvB/TcaC N-terminal domain-containing protein, partial [Longimicrobiaceae bacterium]|nr:SpvB/TcaC N-terminal domain-containing protein [Longimicrobiaceae bacterium]
MSPDPAGAAPSGARVGTLRGDFAVSADGAAVYSIPLALPPGTAGLAPALSLAYSSAAGNGPLGVGWRLAGLSAITRVGASPAQDGFRGAVAYDARDRFSLDGQRLVAVQGVYGAPGAVYHTEIESWRKVEPVHSGVPGRAGPDGFVVREKDGRVLEYGGDAGSRALAGEGNPSVRSWALSRVTDRNGNFVTFRYTQADGESLPAQIDYTGHRGVEPRRSVRFEYETRPDPFTHYVGGFPVRATRRLARIDAYVDGRRVLGYQLEYHEPGSTGRSRLRAVTQLDADGNRLSPTRFEWQDGDPRVFAAAPDVTATGLPFGGSFLPVDVDGDGRVDFVNANRAGDGLVLDHYVARADGRGFAAPARVPATTPPLPFGGQLFPVDVNGDGHTDLVYASRAGTKLRLTVFLAGEDAAGGWSLRPGTPFAGGPELAWGGDLYPADVDGDGATDLVYVERAAGGTRFTVLRSSGGGYEPGPTVATPLPPGGTCLVLDADGDGMADLVYAYRGGGGLQLALLRSDGASLALAGDALLPAGLGLAATGALLPMDLNGDGLADLVHAGRAADGGLVLTPLLSTGAGFLPGAPQAFAGIPFGALLLPGELNGDGMADLAVAVRTGEGPVLRVLLSTGTGFRAADAGQPLRSLSWGALLPVDLDGVGRTGLLNLGQAGGKLTLGSVLPAGAAPDLLHRVTNGLGGTHTVRYRPITDAEVYRHTAASLSPRGMFGGGASGATFTPSATALQPGTPAAIAPAMTAAFPRYVVAAHTRADGRGAAYEYRYAYADAAIDVGGGRGWLGFGTQTSVDVDQGTTTSTRFRQDFPFLGMADVSTVARTADGATMFRTTMAYESTRPYPPTRQPLNTATTTEQFTFGRLDSTQRSTFRHDAFGNATLVADLGDGSGAPLYSHHAFLNDTGRWRIGFGTGTRKTADPEGKVVLAAEETELDPATADPVARRVWHDQSDRWLETR